MIPSDYLSDSGLFLHHTAQYLTAGKTETGQHEPVPLRAMGIKTSEYLGEREPRMRKADAVLGGGGGNNGAGGVEGINEMGQGPANFMGRAGADRGWRRPMGEIDQRAEKEGYGGGNHLAQTYSQGRDVLHYRFYRKVLFNALPAFNDFVPITREFYDESMSGKENRDIMGELAPHLPEEWRTAIWDEEHLVCEYISDGNTVPIGGLIWSSTPSMLRLYPRPL